MAKSEKEKAFTDAQSALDAVLGKREALSFAESELYQDRFYRVDQNGSRVRRVLDPWAPERGTHVKADDGKPDFIADGFSPKFPQLQQRVAEAKTAYDDAFARYVEAARARDAEVARELADSQAKSAEEQAKSAKAQAAAATAQTEIAKAMRNLTVAIFIATAVQAIAAVASCSGPAAKSPDVRPDGGQAIVIAPEASVSASASSPPTQTQPLDARADAPRTVSGGDGGPP